MFLGMIFYDGFYTVCDIDKALFYFNLAGKQHIPLAYYYLGIIYLYFKKEKNKAISYLELAANKNITKAQVQLGIIYSTEKYSLFDIDKAICYLKSAAENNSSEAQYYLGSILMLGMNVKCNLRTGYYYLSLASENKHRIAQYYVGLNNLYGFFVPKNIKKAIDLFTKSSENEYIESHHILGYLYHAGAVVIRDMDKAIKYYKKGSSLNYSFSKNNLGVIYKRGFDKFPKNIVFAIELFKEAINIDNNCLSLYNLAHIYFYDSLINDINESIALLIKSAKEDFYPSKKLLCLAFIKKHNFDLDEIKKDLNSRTDMSHELSLSICNIIKYQKLTDASIFEQKYKKYQSIDFLYDGLCMVLSSNEFTTKNLISKNSKAKNISKEFYEGFGFD